MNRAALRQRLADLLADVSDHAIPVDEVLVAGASLTELGLDSLGFMRLVDAIEAGYGIDFGLDDAPPPDTVDELADQLIRQGLPLTEG
jgi:acyl carrier protein